MKPPAKGVRVRLAPSAFAPLHLGSARLAMLNWLLARRHGGHVVLRLDLPDSGEAPAGHDAAVEQDLRWLGLDWDETQTQAGRTERYAEAAAALKAKGRLYPCLESEEELRFKREVRLRRGGAAVYDRAMLTLTPAQLAAAEAGGKTPYYRFRLSHGTVAWNDVARGRVEVKLPAISDPVLVRADGSFSHAFRATVDDIDAGVTRIVRGEDAIEATGVQMDIASVLGANPSALSFAHVPALQGSAKLEALTLRRLRGDGMEAAAVAACLIEGPQSLPGRPADLLPHFNLPDACAPRRFDVAALRRINRRALAGLSFADVAARLPQGATEAFWLAVRGSLDMLTEARGWWDVVAGTIVPPVLDDCAPLLRTALGLLPAEPWDAGTWPSWTAAVAQASATAPAETATALRLALTGEEDGPDLAALLPMIGHARTAQRLRIAAG